MSRTIQRELDNQLSRMLLDGVILPGQRVSVGPATAGSASGCSRDSRPAGERGCDPAAAGKQAAVDITDLILRDHDEQRRMFALLDELGTDPARLAPVWHRLAAALEVHADAEERLFYPRLLQAGQGAADADSPGEETEDAIRDHNEIRDGIRGAFQHPVGSDGWWECVTAARRANDDHMAEEERQALADFRRHASLPERHELAVEFAVFEAAHAGGVAGRDRDPGQYVDRLTS